MATREEKIAFIQSRMAQQQNAPAPAAQPTREEKLAFVKAKMSDQQALQSATPQQAIEEPKEKPINSAVRGFVQGATLGMSDEVVGGVEAAGKVFGVDGLGGELGDYSFSKEGPTLDWETLRDAYRKARDKERNVLKKDSKDNPVTTGVATVAGAVMTPASKLSAIKNAGIVTQGTALGAATGFGSSNSDLIDSPTEVLKDTGVGSLWGFGGGVLAKGAGAGLKATGKKLGAFAEKSAENATGATGLQASKFKEGAGRELLDRKLVRFGDSPQNISDRTAKAMAQANKQIDDALTKLDADGVKVDGNKIYETVSKKITELKADPSQADVARALEKQIDDLLVSTEAKGSASFGLKEAEGIKRGYNKMAGDWTNQERGQTGKAMYQTYRNAVEAAARKADPNTAKTFEDAKKTYGLLAPVQEAAERRSMTTSQSPVGGFLDMTTAVGGMATGNPAAGVVAPIARKIVAPRISSAAAVTADKASKVVSKLAKPADTDAARRAFNQSLTYNKSTGARLDKAAENDEPSMRKLKGNEKWANDGFNKAIEAKPELSKFKGAMLNNPKAKNLLIEMSDLTPGSKRFNAALMRLEEMGAKN